MIHNEETPQKDVLNISISLKNDTRRLMFSVQNFTFKNMGSNMCNQNQHYSLIEKSFKS